jgi:hypothetical protein
MMTSHRRLGNGHDQVDSFDLTCTLEDLLFGDQGRGAEVKSQRFKRCMAEVAINSMWELELSGLGIYVETEECEQLARRKG